MDEGASSEKKRQSSADGSQPPKKKPKTTNIELQGVPNDGKGSISSLPFPLLYQHSLVNFLSGWYSLKGIFPWVFFVVFYNFVTILFAFTSLLKWGESALSTFPKITGFKSSDIWISLFKYQSSSTSPPRFSLGGKVSILVRPGQS